MAVGSGALARIRLWHSMSDTFYTTLGIPKDSDERQIKRAYHRLARELHPDKAESEVKAREFEQSFALVSTAYNTLKDKTSRQAYDLKTFGEDGMARTGAGSNGTSKNGTGAKTPTSQVLGGAARGGSKSSGGSRGSGSSGRSNTKSSSNGAKPGRGVLTPQREAIAQKAYVKGVQLYREGDFAKAVDFFEAAISNNDTEPSYHARLGASLVGARRSASKAIEAARHAIELDKYNMDFRFNLAHVYETIGSKSNAIKVYKELLKWDADNKAAEQMLRKLTKKKSIFSKLNIGGSSAESFFSGLFKKK